MASDNETVAEILREVREYREPIYLYQRNLLCDRFEAAHKREMEAIRKAIEFRDQYNDLIDNILHGRH